MIKDIIETHKELLDVNWRIILGSIIVTIYDGLLNENIQSLINNTLAKESLEPIITRNSELEGSPTKETDPYSNLDDESIKELATAWVGLDVKLSDTTVGDLTNLYTLSMNYLGAISNLSHFPVEYITDTLPKVLVEIEPTEEEDGSEDEIRSLFEVSPYELLTYISDTYMESTAVSGKKLLVFSYAINVYKILHVI